MSDTEEFEHGTDPNQGIEPLTEENAFKPWERLGISEDEWNDLEESILDEINPGGWKGFLFGDAAESIVLDENGELVLVPPGAMVGYEDGKLKIYPMMENGVGGGLVKGLAKILGAGGKSASTALKNALAKLSPSLRARLASSGLLQGRRGRGRRPRRRCPASSPAAGSRTSRSTPPSSATGRRSSTSRAPATSSAARASRPSRAPTATSSSTTAARNEFAVLKPDGILRTYFRPEDGSDVLAGADRARMTARLDLDPEERDELARLLGEDSLGALLRRWSHFVTQVERGYDDSIYEYTNDLSVRDSPRRASIAGAGPGLRAQLERARSPRTTAASRPRRRRRRGRSAGRRWGHRVPRAASASWPTTSTIWARWTRPGAAEMIGPWEANRPLKSRPSRIAAQTARTPHRPSARPGSRRA